MDFTKMTTSQMIEFLRTYEFGGATGRPRDITFLIHGKPYDLIALNHTGDGLITDIGIRLENSERLEKRNKGKGKS
jgi:hypothetical protein